MTRSASYTSLGTKQEQASILSKLLSGSSKEFSKSYFEGSFEGSLLTVSSKAFQFFKGSFTGSSKGISSEVFEGFL